jgi:prolyl-tRNA synthetase
MGSYGIGVSRLVGAIIEASHDEKGIIWPEAVSPFKLALIRVSNKPEIVEFADNLYQLATEKLGDEVLYDDRDVTAGGKFADNDLIGIPHQVIVGEKSSMTSLEYKNRGSGVRSFLEFDALLNMVG